MGDDAPAHMYDHKKKREEAPTHIKDLLDKHEAVDHIVESTRLHHSDIYQQAAKAAGIWDPDKQEVHYDKLDDIGTQDKFLDEMVSRYVDAAKQAAGFQETDLNDRNKDMLLQEYFGITQVQLKGMLREAGKNYTHGTHTKSVEKLVEKVEERLRGAAQSHLEDKHVEDLLDYAQVPKEKLNVDVFDKHTAADLVRNYDKGKLYSWDELKNSIPKHYKRSEKEAA